MGNPMRTEGGNVDADTTKRPAESLADWLDRHKGLVEAGPAPGPDLHTYWTSGEVWSERTPPYPPPTDAAFIAEHFDKVGKAWLDTPPIP